MGCVYVAFSLYMGFTQAGVDNSAHIGGFIAGALAAIGLPERFDRIDFRRFGRLRLTGITVLFAVVVFCLWRFVLVSSGIPEA